MTVGLGSIIDAATATTSARCWLLDFFLLNFFFSYLLQLISPLKNLACSRPALLVSSGLIIFPPFSAAKVPVKSDLRAPEEGPSYDRRSMRSKVSLATTAPPEILFFLSMDETRVPSRNSVARTGLGAGPSSVDV